MKRLFIALTAGLFAVTAAQADDRMVATSDPGGAARYFNTTILKDNKTGKEYLITYVKSLSGSGQASYQFQVVPMQ